MDRPAKTKLYAFRATPEEADSYRDTARRTGHRSVSAWVRYVLREAVNRIGGKK
jgi:hypothetical protein